MEEAYRTEKGRSTSCSMVNAPWIHRSEIGIFILRLGVSIMVLCHGWPKLLMLIQGQGAEWMDPLGMGSTFSLILCTFAEFICSLAILVGVFTRLAALILVINFWVVIFVYGGESSWAQSELPMLYLICFLTLMCTGAGPLSVDKLLCGRRDRKPS